VPSTNYDGNFTIDLNVVDEGNRIASGVLTLVGIPTSPVLKNNTLTIEEGQSVLLSNSNLQVTPVTRPVTFTISDLQGGYFEWVSNPGKYILQFTEQQINAQQIRFVSNRTALVAYKVGVSDAHFNLPPVSANVIFTNHAPVVVNTPASQEIQVNQPFHFGLVANQTFMDIDGDPLTFTAALSNGTALPNWIQFDASQPNQLDFSGTASSVGSTYVSVFAKDPLNATARADFGLFAVNNGTVNTIANGSSGGIAGAVIGGLLGLGALVGAGFGFWRYATDKTTRKGEEFADYIRDALRLKGVGNFKDHAEGKRYLAMVNNLTQALQQAGIDATVMRTGELRELANDVAGAARNKISPAADCLGRSEITVDDLNSKLQDIIADVQILRSSSVQQTNYTM
jgi:hypothetical protein